MKLKKYIWDYVFLLSIAGVVVLLDQWTKDLVRMNLAIGERWMPLEWLAPYARIIHWQNTGAAFGMGQNFGLIFAGLAVLVVLAILFYFPQVERDDWLIRVALGMQMGGALGNLVDRVTQDLVVTDFVSVGRFAVWNIADASIFVGTLILILGVWLQERKMKQQEEEAQRQAELAALEADAAANEPGVRAVDDGLDGSHLVGKMADGVTAGYEENQGE